MRFRVKQIRCALQIILLEPNIWPHGYDKPQTLVLPRRDTLHAVQTMQIICKSCKTQVLLPEVITTLLEFELLQRTFWNNELLSMRGIVLCRQGSLGTSLGYLGKPFGKPFHFVSHTEGTSARPVSKGIRFAQWHPQQIKMRPCALTYLAVRNTTRNVEYINVYTFEIYICIPLLCIN